MATDLVEVAPRGALRLHMHPGQLRAWDSRKRFIGVLAGTQGGKTSFGPHWLYREIQRRGPGDYMVVTPTFTLLELKALPEFRRLFDTLLRLGRYTGSPVRKFTFSTDGEIRTFGAPQKIQTNVIFGYAADPESLESATAKAAWLDEAGQKKFKLASWEAILRRLSIAQGRALITTTPYDLGWLKQKIWDPYNQARREGKEHPTIDVVRFDSTENPNFPQEEFERARADLPEWKFNLFYRAIFTRPAGLIYDAFSEDEHTIDPFAVPDHWKRYLGLDFGGVNTVGLFYAAEQDSEGKETGRFILYRAYKAGGRTAKEHTRELLDKEPMMPFAVGGSKSEGQWRDEFRAAGLSVKEPDISEVEVGIDRVYGGHKQSKIVVFKTLAGYLEEKLTYSRVLDEQGEPTEDIEDKSTFHHMDAERYIMGWLLRDNISPRKYGKLYR